MDLDLSHSERAFRDECRVWLDANRPGELPRGDLDQEFAFRLAWQRTLFDGGWCGVAWPVEHGGRGATLYESALFNEELARVRAPQSANLVAEILAGPTLMDHASPEQCSRFLEPMLSGEEIWCQGFSEPEAGSDLAAMKTRARRVNGGYAITGQKVWTSWAQYSRWCLLLARTGAPDSAHRGISCFVLDMENPAIDRRPLRQITGDAEFNELFLDDAFVPESHMVGREGEGWAIAMTTLMHERSNLVFRVQVELEALLADLFVEAVARDVLGDPELRRRLGKLRAKVEILRLTSWSGLTRRMATGLPGSEGSMAKWLWAETNQEVTELAVDVLGLDALDSGSTWAYELLRARGNTIEGGTTEIQANIVAERMLGLPRSR